jgi:MoaD family protein
MKVRIKYFASVREMVNLREELVDIPSGSDVGGLLEHLASRHGGTLREYLFDDAGTPRPYLQFLLNEKSVSETGGFSTLITEGSVFAIIPPVGGG